MFRLHLKIALRNLLKQKGYAFINVFGLSTGLCAFFLILFYVADDLSYDRFYKNADRIVRVVHQARWEGGSLNLAPTSLPFGPALKADYKEVQDAAYITGEAGGLFSYGTQQIKADDVFFADSSFLKIFDYQFLYGDPKNSLSVTGSILLTEKLARKLFGTAGNAMGKMLTLDKNPGGTVTGVIADIPENTHLKFSALRSAPANQKGSWQQFSGYTYLLLAPGTDYKILESRLPEFYKKHFKGEMGVEDYKMSLQPVTSIHLHSDLDYEISPNGNMKYISIFIAAAILILLIAIINYMNLATARSSVRAREVGVRKVVGAERKQIMLSFWLESVLLTLLACLLAALMVELLLPYFNQLAGKSLSTLKYGLPFNIMFIIVFAIVVGTLSGSYPAFLLSGFSVINALKGKTGTISGHGVLRKALVVFQFTITITMVIVSWVIYRQMQYVMTSDLGFDKQQVLTFHLDDENTRLKVNSLKHELLRSPLIKKVGVAGNPIGNNNIGTSGFYFETEKGFNPTTNIVQLFTADEDLLPAMGIEMAQGRNLSAKQGSDQTRSILINETLVKELGLKNPIGKRMRTTYVNEKGQQEERTIVGVFKDFHTYSLQHKIQGMLLYMAPRPQEQDNLYVRIDPRQINAALQWIRTVYSRFDRVNPVEFHFLDDNFAAQYESEQRQENLLLIFTLLAISIALLGMYGLSTFITSQRTKEIAVRRVLGASAMSIVSLLNSGFIKITLLASLLSWPAAYFFCNRWLEDFAYHIQTPWLPFVWSSALCMAMVFLTVSYKTWKAAKANPADALKYE